MVDHDTRRLVWAASDRDKVTLGAFFDALGPERSARITHVSADGADWISDVVLSGASTRSAARTRSTSCGGTPTPSVRSAARPGTRPEVPSPSAAPGGPPATPGLEARRLRVVEEPAERDHPAAGEAGLGKTGPPVWTGPTSREGLRLIFQLPYSEAVEALTVWIGWASRCRIPAFVDQQRRILKHRDSILAAIEHGLSNGRIESVDTKVSLLTRIASGFRSPPALIVLAMLNLGGHKPVLPGRT